MSALDQELYQEVLYSKEWCSELVEYLDTLPRARWFHRPRINSVPTAGSSASDYNFLGDKQMPSELREYLFDVAPKIEGAHLAEVVINQYPPGGFMSEHIDRALYKHNLVIQLSENGDGIIIEDTFFEDSAGFVVIFPTNSPPHSVPVVKTRRYVMICLYE